MLAQARSAALFLLALCAAGFPARLQASRAGQQSCGPLRLAISSAAGSSIPKGLTRQLQATRFFFRGRESPGDATQQVQWISSDKTVATVAAGLVRALPQNPATCPCPVTITAASGPLRASFQITVLPPALISMSVLPASDDVPIGMSNKGFTSIGLYSDGNSNAVPANWASSNTSVATISTGGGVATGKADGTVTITATDPATNISATAILNVDLSSITVAPVNPMVAKGDPEQFTATGSFGGGATGVDVTNDVVWSSSSTIIATISTTGLVTTAQRGTATIAAASGAVGGSTLLTVTAPVVKSIVVTPANPKVLVGKVKQFAATAIYSDGAIPDVTTQAMWSSSVPGVAGVGTNTGQANTITTGSTTISATFMGVTGGTLLTVRPGSRFAYIANQGDNTISIYAPNENTGNLRDIGYALLPAGQAGPQALTTDPGGKFLYVANATNNNISGFTINNATGQLTAMPGAPFVAGTNPSSIAIDASGRFAYVSNQGTGNLSAFSIDALGNLSPLSTKSYTVGSGPTQVAIDPSGNFLYVANSGSTTISAFKRNLDGSLTAVGALPFSSGGFNPGAMAFDSAGKYLLVVNNGSANIVVWSIDSTTGALNKISGSTYPTAPSPIAIASDPSGTNFYASSSGSSFIDGFTLNDATGALTAIAGSPFAAPGPAKALAIDAPGLFLYTVGANTDATAIFTIQGDGSLTPVKTTRARNSPAAMVLSAGSDGQYMPSFVEVATQTANGGVLSYSVNPANGALTLKASVITDANDGSSAVATDPSGQFVYSAQENAGLVSGFTLDPNFGVLTSIPGSTLAAGLHPASMVVEPSGRFLYTADVALISNVFGYQINSTTGALVQITGSPSSAGRDPLGIAADPTGRFLYSANFDDNSVRAFAVDPATGVLSALTPAFTSAAPQALAVHPTGRFLYVANGNALNSIQLFGIDPNTGALTGGGTNVPSGRDVTSIAIDPEGRFLYAANFSDNTITAFTVDQNSGQLSQSSPAFPASPGGGPFAISVDPSGQFLYVAERNIDEVSVFTIDQVTGALSGRADFAAPSTPNGLAVTGSLR